MLRSVGRLACDSRVGPPREEGPVKATTAVRRSYTGCEKVRWHAPCKSPLRPHADVSERREQKADLIAMKLHVKVPPPPRLPTGLIALVRTSNPPHASPSDSAEPAGIAEPVEATRAWKPDRSLLQTNPQPTSASDFSLAADEQTMVGVLNLNDPSLFRSEPPFAPNSGGDVDGLEDEGTTIDFVGALADFDQDEATPASVWGEENTRLYKPQRSRLPPEEPDDEFDTELAAADAASLGPGPPKVIIASAVLADSMPDPTRAEATKKKRRGRPGTDTKLGLYLCVLGGLALAFSVAWRHPRTAPVTHVAFARAAAVAASLLGR